MAEIKVNLSHIFLVLSPEAKTEIARKLLTVLDQQARASISGGTGQPFPPGKTKNPIDLHDTGRLFSDVDVTPEGLRFNAPYAQAVEDKWHFANLAPSYMARWLKAIDSDIRSGLEAHN